MIYQIQFIILGYDYYIDPSIELSNIELGTFEHPFKAFDDPFREIFNHAVNLEGDFLINIRYGSNLTIHSIGMPLLILNTNITIV